MSVCAFTGHRILTDDFDPDLLKRVIINLAKTGVKRFLCGMAFGFDLEAARAVLSLRKKYKLELVACLPCEGQEARFSAKNKELYKSVLEQCDEVVTMEPAYVSGCMHKRDRYLVDNSDILVCFFKAQGGRNLLYGKLRTAQQ